jgi:hypothetical protein
VVPTLLFSGDLRVGIVPFIDTDKVAGRRILKKKKQGDVNRKEQNKNNKKSEKRRKHNATNEEEGNKIKKVLFLYNLNTFNFQKSITPQKFTYF